MAKTTKKFWLCMALVLANQMILIPAQANFFPEETQQLCVKANHSKLVKELDACVNAQLETAENFLKESFAKALTHSGDQAYTLSEQKQWLGNRDILCPKDERLGPLANYLQKKCLFALTVSRALELAASVRELPPYPKQILKSCSSATTQGEQLVCMKEKLAFDKKNLEEKFQKVLAKSSDKTSLENEQNAWFHERDEICPYDSFINSLGQLSYLECVSNRTRARTIELEEQAELPGS